MDAGMMRIERNGGGWLEAWSTTAMGFYSFYQNMGPMNARYVYGGLFLIANFIAWGLRENPTLLFQRQRLSGCQGNRDCFAAEAVLMISFTFFLFFFAMFFSTVYTTSMHGLRNRWHSKCWVPKIVLLAICFVISIFAPNYVTQLYGKVAPFGAGLFLIVQLISVIRYITQLHSRWCGQHFDNNRRKVKTISLLAGSSSLVGIILMVSWYLGCYVNTALVSSTGALVYIMGIISFLSKEKGSYMEPLLMGVYIVFLCWSAVKSEPETIICYKKENTGSGGNWITIISCIAELTSVTVAAFSTGTDYKSMQFTNAVESEDDIPYGYGFFHFAFATGCMDFGMLLLGWDTHHASEKWSMDVGWTSMLVHVANEGVAVVVFVAVLLARYYQIGWLEQLLGRMLGIGGQQQQQPTVPGADNIGAPPPPQESPTSGREGAETGNNGPPETSSTTTTDEIEVEAPQVPNPLGTEERDNAQPSSSSSMTGTLLRVSVAPPVLGSSRQSEIEEEC